MSAQPGSKMQLAIGDGGVPVESFTTIGGITATALRIEQDIRDATDAADNAWRRVHSASGIRHMRLQAEGVFTDSAAEATLRVHAFAGTVATYRLQFGNGDVVEGPFLVMRYEQRGQRREPQAFEVILTSAGTVSVATA